MNNAKYAIANGDGWQIELFQVWDDARLVQGRRPVLIVPGYGMNSFIFSFHPAGLSLVDYLAEAGFEVWRVDLRGQGASSGGSPMYRLEDLATVDLDAAIRAVQERTRTGAARVDVIGASLGGTIMFLHAALDPDHAIGSMVAIGSPVRWVEVHPALALAFSSPELVEQIRFYGTRRVASLLLPVLASFAPWLLSVYMNAEITDVSRSAVMCQTVEDPNRHVNRQIAEWIRDKDLVVRGVNVFEQLRSMTAPLLCVVALGDGIVPRKTAESPYDVWGGSDKQLLLVGSDDVHVAHADLFISRLSHEKVFAPMAAWLAGPRG